MKIVEKRDKYYCGNENCDYETTWGLDDYSSKGEPVCPYCGCDMYKAPLRLAEKTEKKLKIKKLAVLCSSVLKQVV